MKSIEEQILSFVSDLDTPGFFITVEFSKRGKEMPQNLEAFICSKLALIRNGINGRKFTFCEDEWRMVLTYFPTDSVVDEKYALKNKIRH